MILARVDSVPAGTRIVVYDTGGGNSADRGINPAELRPQIEQKIRARGAQPIFANYVQIIGAEKGNPAWLGDGHHHFSAASHTRVAAALLPAVIAAIGKH